MNYTILQNKIRCKKCEAIIESKDRNDFRMCDCKSVGVDGGKEYLRRIGSEEDYEELSVVEVPIVDVDEKVIRTIKEENRLFCDKIKSYKKMEKRYNRTIQLIESYIDNEGWIQGGFLEGTKRIHIDKNGIEACKNILKELTSEHN